MYVRLRAMLAMLPIDLERLLPAWRHAGTHLPEQSLQPLRRPQLQLLHDSRNSSAHEAVGWLWFSLRGLKHAENVKHGP